MAKNVPDLFRSGFWGQDRELSRLQRGIDRLFDNFITPSDFVPSCDIEETENNYQLTFDLPGLKKEDIKIELREGSLIVSGERKQESKKEKGNSVSVERFQGSFSRVFNLPSPIDAEKVEASYQDGVLEIRIPKTEAAKPKLIQVQDIKSKGKAA